jgi:hypothetical protein
VIERIVRVLFDAPLKRSDRLARQILLVVNPTIAISSLRIVGCCSFQHADKSGLLESPPGQSSESGAEQSESGRLWN